MVCGGDFCVINYIPQWLKSSCVNEAYLSCEHVRWFIYNQFSLLLIFFKGKHIVLPFLFSGRQHLVMTTVSLIAKQSGNVGWLLLLISCKNTALITQVQCLHFFFPTQCEYPKFPHFTAKVCILTENGKQKCGQKILLFKPKLCQPRIRAVGKSNSTQRNEDAARPTSSKELSGQQNQAQLHNIVCRALG